jgi:hypothetical protein
MADSRLLLVTDSLSLSQSETLSVLGGQYVLKWSLNGDKITFNATVKVLSCAVVPYCCDGHVVCLF